MVSISVLGDKFPNSGIVKFFRLATPILFFHIYFFRMVLGRYFCFPIRQNRQFVHGAELLDTVFRLGPQLESMSSKYCISSRKTPVNTSIRKLPIKEDHSVNQKIID